ncbi:hypothetical protein TW86_09010 [Halomonas sp. S2151]|nr:hypothetical protein TW86_09010 [Halomonas sp. S2151]
MNSRLSPRSPSRPTTCWVTRNSTSCWPPSTPAKATCSMILRIRRPAAPAGEGTTRAVVLSVCCASWRR